jgi:hypothetical protein
MHIILHKFGNILCSTVILIKKPLFILSEKFSDDIYYLLWFFRKYPPASLPPDDEDCGELQLLPEHVILTC